MSHKRFAHGNTIAILKREILIEFAIRIVLIGCRLEKEINQRFPD
jgi:hypothetical protein